MQFQSLYWTTMLFNLSLNLPNKLTNQPLTTELVHMRRYISNSVSQDVPKSWIVIIKILIIFTACKTEIQSLQKYSNPHTYNVWDCIDLVEWVFQDMTLKEQQAHFSHSFTAKLTRSGLKITVKQYTTLYRSQIRHPRDIGCTSTLNLFDSIQSVYYRYFHTLSQNKPLFYKPVYWFLFNSNW